MTTTATSKNGYIFITNTGIYSSNDDIVLKSKRGCPFYFENDEADLQGQTGAAIVSAAIPGHLGLSSTVEVLG